MEKPKSPNPERLSPEVFIKTTYGEVALNYFNTRLYGYHDKRFKDVEHIAYKPDEEKPAIAIFGQRALFKKLKKLDFPITREAWPSDDDEDLFVEVETRDIDSDINQLFGEEAA